MRFLSFQLWTFLACTPCRPKGLQEIIIAACIQNFLVCPNVTKIFFFFFSYICIKNSLLLAHWKLHLFFHREWLKENMEIDYVQENSRAALRHEHAASMRLQLEETLGTFNGYFFGTLYFNAAVHRVTFGYVTHSSSFNDVHFRLHILQPYTQPGTEATNYFNFHTFVMSRRLCYTRNCKCPLHHTELIEYSKS